MSNDAGVVIVGMGMAGAQTALALRQKRYSNPILLVGDEPHPPYQRPPLSKAFLKDDTGEHTHLRPEPLWAQKDVDLVTGIRAIAIDRDAQTVRLEDGRRVRYEHLVLATGARNRPLPGGYASLDGVLYLRTVDEAVDLRSRLVGQAVRLVVIGGGFIGMEVAAAARERGVHVVVVEGLDRIMSRAVSPTISEFFSAAHGRRGVRILTSRRVTRLHGTERVTAVELADGEVLPADLVVVGIGVVPNTALADKAHIETGDGVIVDEHLQTSDPAISAVGDCARFPCSVTGANICLESIQNATDHARTVAARLTGDRQAHVAIPWFWTEQYGHRLQIAGATTGDELSSVVRQVSGSEGFSVGRFAGHRLVSLESVDQPADHMAARKLLLSGAEVTPRQVADTSTPLKASLESEPAI